MTDERRLVILVNDRIKMSRGKYAAQAVHAALLALGVHPGCAVIVLGGHPAVIGMMKTTVHDAGRTEVAPHTLTAGTDWEEDSENSDRERRASFRWRIPVFGRRFRKAPAKDVGDRAAIAEATGSGADGAVANGPEGTTT